jgi:hypothetical protein
MTEQSYLPSATRRTAGAKPTSFHPTVEALEDRLVLSPTESLSLSAVGLTLEHGPARGVAVVEQNLGGQAEALIRLRRVVDSGVMLRGPVTTQVPGNATPMTSLKYTHLQTMDGGTAPVVVAATRFLKIDF